MRRLYRLLLLAYPRDLRREHGAEMCAVVEQAWQHAARRGIRARGRFAARLITDFVTSLPGEWRAHGTRSPRRRNHMVSRFLTETRIAWRSLWRSPWSTAATVLTLSLAIGAATAVFGVTRAAVLRPLAFDDADRLVMLWERHVPRNREHNVVGAANFLAWQDRATSYESLVAMSLPGAASITRDGPPERIPAFAASWDFLDVLGVAPDLGRRFTEADGTPNAPWVVLIGWNLWQRRYGGDPDVIGRTTTVNGRATEIVGVLPRGFRFLDVAPEALAPLRLTAADREPDGRSMRVLARLRNGVSIGDARAELNTLSASLEQQWPDFNAGWRASLVPLEEELTGPVRRPMLLLLGAVLLLLLVGCANTANLLLARAAARQNELAVRSALGASRWQLFRQLFVEGALLAVVGTAGGLLVARLGLAAARRSAERGLDLRRIEDAAIDGGVLLFSFCLMAGCTLVFSLAPALQRPVRQLDGVMRRDGRASAGSTTERLARRGLVVAQVSVAVILVVAAGLAGRTLANLTAVPTGFDQDGVLTMTITLPSAEYSAPGADVRFFQDALDHLRALPGVEEAGAITWLPFTGIGGGTAFTRVDREEPAPTARPVADIRPIDPRYFAAMGIPLHRGRVFTDSEFRDGPPVAIVNQALADLMYPDEDPIGKRMNVRWGSAGPDEIVGVVGDVRHGDLREPIRPMIYFPYGRAALGTMTVVLRTEGDARALERPAVGAVQQLDPDLPVADVKTMRERVGEATATPALATWLVGMFAALALVLALVGIGGLLAAGVARRETEFGIRLALGAEPARLRRLVLGEAVGLAGLGLVVGLGVARLASSAAADLLFDVSAADPLVYGATIVAIIGTALAASDVPARRATRVHPALVLKR